VQGKKTNGAQCAADREDWLVDCGTTVRLHLNVCAQGRREDEDTCDDVQFRGPRCVQK